VPPPEGATRGLGPQVDKSLCPYYQISKGTWSGSGFAPHSSVEHTPQLMHSSALVAHEWAMMKDRFCEDSLRCMSGMLPCYPKISPTIDSLQNLQCHRFCIPAIRMELYRLMITSHLCITHSNIYQQQLVNL